MKVTIIYDNEAHAAGMVADWGFSCLVEVENTPRMLFDTGASGDVLLQNMARLGIDPDSIDEVFISHGHWDHTGGLAALMQVNAHARLYLPASMGRSYPSSATIISQPTQIHEDIYSTGELHGIEQSLVVGTPQGAVVIVGCSHPGVGAILDAAAAWGQPHAIIGGLHGFRDFERLRGMGLICACHCSQFRADIEKIFKDQYNSGGAGRTLQI